MSRVRADKLVDRAGTGAVELTQGATLPSGKTISGSGSIAAGLIPTLNQDTTGTAAGLTGSPDITVNNITGVAATFSGVLTYDDVTNVDSIGVVTARSGLKVTSGGINVIGGGATVTGVTTFFNDIRVKGVIENVSAATTFLDANSKVVLELDLLGSTTYSYVMQPASIGIVSFKNMPADAQGGATVTVLFTQASDTTGGVGNTTHDVGLGTDCTVIPNVGGAAQAGISTRAFVGGGTTFVGLSTTPGDKEFVSFFVHYNGGTNTDANSYDIFVTKNGQFRPSAVGV
jgi:hypothetical protein